MKNLLAFLGGIAAATYEALAGRATWGEAAGEHELRVRDAAQFRSSTFKRARLAGLKGVAVVVGRLKAEHVAAGTDAELLVAQSFRFGRNESWTRETSEAWAKTNAITAARAVHEGDARALMALGALGCTEIIEEACVASDVAPGLAPDNVITLPQRAAAGRLGPLRATFEVPVVLRAQGALGAAADALPVVDFILCHAGANDNGDEFTAEELEKAAPSAVGAPINCDHSLATKAIVGQVTSSRFVRDDAGEGPHVACAGDILIGEAPEAAMVHAFLKRGILAWVSMECNYQFGTCSTCGHKVDRPGNLCAHLAKYKGRELRGKRVTERLNGVQFTGAALLHQRGADPRAQVRRVANLDEGKGGMAMDEAQMQAAIEKAKSDARAEADKAIAEARAEADKLKTAVADKDKELETLRKKDSERSKAEREAAVKAIADKLKELGGELSEEKAKALLAMDDVAYAAAAGAYLDTIAGLEREAAKRKKNEEDKKKAEEERKGKGGAQASRSGTLRTQASAGGPARVDDKSPEDDSLEARLARTMGKVEQHLQGGASTDEEG